MSVKKMITNLLYGYGSGETDYEFNGVKYIVESKFEPENEDSIKDRFGRCLTHLTDINADNKIDNRYVCLTAGKED